MIQPATTKLKAYRGVTFDTTLTVNVNGALLNLTGYTAIFKVKGITLTQTAGITLGGTAGTITVLLTEAQTTSLPVGSHHYYLTINSGSRTDLIMHGSMDVKNP